MFSIVKFQGKPAFVLPIDQESIVAMKLHAIQLDEAEMHAELDNLKEVEAKYGSR